MWGIIVNNVVYEVKRGATQRVPPFCSKSPRAQRRHQNSKGKGGRVPGRTGPWENWEKVQVLWICRGLGVVPSRVVRDEYRI